MMVWGRVLALAGRRRFGWGVFGLFAMLLSMHGVDAADAPYLAVVPPAVASRPALKYPPQAIAARHQGEVMLLIVVGKDGEPKDIRVDHGSGFPELDAAAVEAVEQWKFKPELKFGIPVQATIKLPVDFNLSILSGDRLPIATGALSDELLRIELPQGNAFTASLETGNLIPSHHVPFKPLAGQHAFPGLPPDPSGYAQTLETAYHNAYVAASSHAEPLPDQLPAYALASLQGRIGPDSECPGQWLPGRADGHRGFAQCGRCKSRREHGRLSAPASRSGHARLGVA
jgi:TonB family protein